MMPVGAGWIPNSKYMDDVNLGLSKRLHIEKISLERLPVYATRADGIIASTLFLTIAYGRLSRWGFYRHRQGA
jgi:hypothetical protein